MGSKAYADERDRIHKNHASSRPLSEDYELVGIMGELALSQLTGLAPDLATKPAGDGGVDSLIYLRYTVDIKTARKPYNLIHEVGKKFADIFILSKYTDPDTPVRLMGWEWGKVLQAAPTREFGHGVMNHYISAKSLRRLGELQQRVIKLS